MAVRPLTGFGGKYKHKESAHDTAAPDSRASGPGQAPSTKASPEDRPWFARKKSCIQTAAWLALHSEVGDVRELACASCERSTLV